MHGSDDHGKNTHFCAADYSLQITTPEKVRRKPFTWTASDGNWDRPITLKVNGFSTDGRHVFLSIAEDNYPGEIEAVNYDMLAGSITSDVFLDYHFTRRLSQACAATLHLVGVSSAGFMVLGTGVNDGCGRKTLWQLSPNRMTGRTSGAVIPEYPKRMSLMDEIDVLEFGSVVEH